MRRLIIMVAAATLAVPLTAQKQIDIGAAEAPLSDAQRVDLDKAVTKHNFAAEKAVIDQALAEHPNSFELLVMAARLAYLEKHAKDSADWFLRAEKISPVNDSDRTTLGLALSFSGNAPLARAEFQTLIRNDPRNSEYPFLLARIDANSKHFEDAVAEFRKAVELDPGLVRAYEGLGRAQESLGLADEARKTYELGAARNRSNRLHWEWSPLDLGVVLLKADQVDEADKLFQEALQYNPHFGVAHYYRGQALQKKNSETEAMSEYKLAVADDPRLREAWLALGRQYTKQGNQAEADKALQRFKQIEAEDNAHRGKNN